METCFTKCCEGGSRPPCFLPWKGNPPCCRSLEL